MFAVLLKINYFCKRRLIFYGVIKSDYAGNK